MIYAKILADSINPAGVRLTTMEIECHRFVLAELNTHRMFSRNSASSRAIPVVKQLERFVNEPANPISWPVEQKGMSGGAELVGQDLTDAQEMFERIRAYIASELHDYIENHTPDHRLHKSLLNRPMEFGQYHRVIISATDWENFFTLRCAPEAQPEIRAVAEEMKKAYEASAPKKLKYGEWHLPLTGFSGDEELQSWDLVKVSCARCARVSYLTHDGVRDVEADLDLFDRLKQNGHMSPFEHAAQATNGKGYTGNFRGFKQARHYVETGDPPIERKPRKPRKNLTRTSVTTRSVSMPKGVFGTFVGNYYTINPTRYINWIPSQLINPKAYFSSPRCIDRTIMVVAENMNAADRVMRNIQRDLMQNPMSWINQAGRQYNASPSHVYGRLNWQFVGGIHTLRGLNDIDVVLINGWMNRSDFAEVQADLDHLSNMGKIKYIIEIS